MPSPRRKKSALRDRTNMEELEAQPGTRVHKTRRETRRDEEARAAESASEAPQEEKEALPPSEDPAEGVGRKRGRGSHDDTVGVPAKGAKHASSTDAGPSTRASRRRSSQAGLSTSHDPASETDRVHSEATEEPADAMHHEEEFEGVEPTDTGVEPATTTTTTTTTSKASASAATSTSSSLKKKKASQRTSRSRGPLEPLPQMPRGVRKGKGKGKVKVEMKGKDEEEKKDFGGEKEKEEGEGEGEETEIVKKKEKKASARALHKSAEEEGAGGGSSGGGGGGGGGGEGEGGEGRLVASSEPFWVVDESVTASAVARARELAPASEARVLEQSTELYALDETQRSLQDPLLFRPYAADVMHHLKELEVAYEIDPTYPSTVQNEVDEGMRAILVDWLVEVVEEYRLMPETLYISVQLMDRYMTRCEVTRADLQLLGIACIILAGKMEEIWIPPIDDFISISDNTYSRERIVAMEATVAAELEFRLKTATAKTFMHRFLRAGGARRGDNQTALVKYLAELTLQERRFLVYRPSLVCAAAQLVARRLDDIRPAWTPTLKHVTGYSEAELEDCAEDICCAHRDASHIIVKAVFEKYSHTPYNRVAISVPPMPPRDGEPHVIISSAKDLTANTY